MSSFAIFWGALRRLDARRCRFLGASLALLVGTGMTAAACSDDEAANAGPSGAGGNGATGGPTGGITTTGGPGGTNAATTGATAATGATGGTTGSGGSVACPPGGGGVPPLKLTQVASDLDFPLFAAGSPGDPSRLFVLEQEGTIRLVKDGTLLPDPFLDLRSSVQGIEFQNDERGLLGLAFHPQYAQNGRFFVHYTDVDSEQGVIAEYARSSDSDKANPTPTKIVLEVVGNQMGNHNGGMISFGPDGYLYIGLGDGGGSGDPNGSGQDPQTMLGKILRIDVDTYPTPVPGNLPNGNPHAWDWGLRNPWRFSFDRCTGDLYIGDVGQKLIEEVDVEAKGQGHNNYGWNQMEGTQCYEPASGCDTSNKVLPATQFEHSADCSVTGGYVYRGSRIPGLVGVYLYSDYCSNRIRTLVWSNGQVVSEGDLTDDLESQNLLGISSFGEDANGELYVVDHGGAVYRIDPE